MGAGASKDAGVSTVVELVDDFRGVLKSQPDKLLTESVEEILSFIKKWKAKRQDHSRIDVEQFPCSSS
jgi:hypothetical protein